MCLYLYIYIGTYGYGDISLFIYFEIQIHSTSTKATNLKIIDPEETLGSLWTLPLLISRSPSVISKEMVDIGQILVIVKAG